MVQQKMRKTITCFEGGNKTEKVEELSEHQVPV